MGLRDAHLMLAGAGWDARRRQPAQGANREAKEAEGGKVDGGG